MAEPLPKYHTQLTKVLPEDYSFEMLAGLLLWFDDFSVNCRQKNCEGRSFFRGAAHFNMAPMSLNNRLDQTKAKSQSPLSTTLIASEQALPYPRKILL